jgi:hypothetical protein
MYHALGSRRIYIGIRWESQQERDREMGGYTSAISGQQPGKHVPFARQQILNNAKVGLQQWKSCVFYVVRADRL